MKKLNVCLFILLLSAGFCLSQNEESQYDYLKDILESLKRTEREYPIEGDLALEVAFVYMKIGKYDEAANVLKKELNLHPSDDNARLFLGIAYFNNHEVQKSLNEFKIIGKKLKQDKGYEAMRKRLREFALSERRMEGNYDKIKRPSIFLSEGKLGLFHFAYGCVLKSIKDFNKAVENFLVAIKAGYDEKKIRWNLIQTFISQKNMYKAKEELWPLEKKNGKDEKILFIRGYFYNLEGQREKAAQVHSKRTDWRIGR